MFYNNNYLASILSFSEVTSIFLITFDTEIDSKINANIKNRTRIKFNQGSGDLYNYNNTNMENNKTNNQVTDYYFLITV